MWIIKSAEEPQVLKQKDGSYIMICADDANVVEISEKKQRGPRGPYDKNGRNSYSQMSQTKLERYGTLDPIEIKRIKEERRNADVDNPLERAGKKKRTMSPSARKKLAAAARKRWVQAKKEGRSTL